MLDANTKTARSITVGAVLVLTCVHSAMSATFGWSLGAQEFEKYLFATFGVCTDICKVFALAFAAYAFERRRLAKGLCCLLVWATTVAYSGVAALGFAALARDTVTASRSADVDEYRQNTAEKRRLLADMEAARTNPLFEETYGCTRTPNEKATSHAAERARTFCYSYWHASVKYDEIKPVLKQATLTQADPQTAILASLLSISRERAAIALAIFLAVVAEIVSALGTWTFSRSMRKPDKALLAERAERAERRRQRPQLVVNNQ